MERSARFRRGRKAPSMTLAKFGDAAGDVAAAAADAPARRGS